MRRPPTIRTFPVTAMAVAAMATATVRSAVIVPSCVLSRIPTMVRVSATAVRSMRVRTFTLVPASTAVPVGGAIAEYSDGRLS